VVPGLASTLRRLEESPLSIMAVLFQSSKNSLRGHGKLFVTFGVMNS